MSKKKKSYKKGGKQTRAKVGDYSLYIVFSAAIVLIIVFVVCVTLLFNVGGFDVSGDAPYTPQQVTDASGIKLGDSLLWLDPDEVSDNITSQLPFVDTVSVKRILPRTVKIVHTRAVPLFYAVVGGEAFAVSQNLKILETITKQEFSARESSDDGIIAVTGVTDFDRKTAGENRSLQVAAEIVVAAKNEGLKLSGTIDLSSLIDIKIMYMRRVDIRLGTRGDIAEQMKVAAAMLTDYIGADETGILRVQNPQRFSFEPVAAADIEAETVELPETATAPAGAGESAAPNIAAGAVTSVPAQSAETTEPAEQSDEEMSEEEVSEISEVEPEEQAEDEIETDAAEPETAATLPEPAKPPQDIYITAPDDSGGEAPELS